MKFVIIFLLFVTIIFTHKNKNSTHQYLNDTYRLMYFNDLDFKREVILPIYNTKYRYNKELKRWIRLSK